MIRMEMGPGFGQVKRELAALGGQVEDAVSDGLEEYGQHAASYIIENYLTGQYLHRRTGMLAKELTSWMIGPHEVAIGIPEDSPVGKYAYLLGDEEVTITPKNAQFLTIPIGEGLTPSGVPRYSSPKDVPEGFFLRTKSGQLLFGYKVGKRGKFRPLFVLVKSVVVQGTGALIDGVMETLDDGVEIINRRLGRIKDVS